MEILTLQSFGRAIRRRRTIAILSFIAIIYSLLILHAPAYAPKYFDRKLDQLGFLRQSEHLRQEMTIPLPDDQGLYAAPVRRKGRIIVTGGGGNIGKHLVHRLLSSHIATTVVDLIFHPQELSIFQELYPSSGFEFIQADIRNHTVLRQALSHSDGTSVPVIGVINLAAVSRVLWCLENERDCQSVNIAALDSILDITSRLAETTGSRPWLIQASSREVYGVSETFPVEEHHPTLPANVYGSSKLGAEEAIIRHVGATTNLRAIALRLSNVYGGVADHKERLVPAIMTNAMAHRPIQIVGGNQELDMVHIDDVVDAIILAMHRLENAEFGSGWFPFLGFLRSTKNYRTITKASSVEFFNVVGQSAVPAVNLVKKILMLTKSQSAIQLIPADERFPDKYQGSPDKAERMLGYKARIGIDEGLHRLAAAYYTQTERFLHKKQLGDCSKGEYGKQDLLRLDGCLGNVAASLDGTIGLLDYEPPKEGQVDGLREWRWTDTIHPWTFKFDVKEKEDGRVRLIIRDWTNKKSWREFIHEETGAIFNITNRLPGGPDDSDTEFIMTVHSGTGHIALQHASTGFHLKPPKKDGETISITREPGPNPYMFRLIPVCCAGQNAPWPFFQEDPVASLINDHKRVVRHLFNASSVDEACQRLSIAHQVVKLNLDRLKEYARPITLGMGELPLGKYNEWAFAERDSCSNLCDHPTICLDTQSCACVKSNCVPQARFPFSAYANVDRLSYGEDHDTALKTDPRLSLVEQVNRTSWLSVLHAPASRYLSRNPAFPRINVGSIPPDLQASYDAEPDRFTDFHNINGCFSADVSFWRTIELMDRNATVPPALTFVPVLERFGFYQDLQPIFDHVAPVPQVPFIVPFTHDWGGCNTFVWNVYEVRRDQISLGKVMNGNIAFSVMGDLNSNCYRPDQDIIIPPRTCLAQELHKRYSDMRSVKPVRHRKVLTTFSGSIWGTGAHVRTKVICDRPVKPRNLIGGERLEILWQSKGNYKDYLDLLNETVFCPLIKGTTGWATRTVDVIYAGCIPVIIGKEAHFPFWDMIDYGKISISVTESEIDRLEEILLSYTWEQIEVMQANLMLVRDAFMYPLDGRELDALTTRGPAFFALHSAALGLLTKYPTATSSNE